MQNMTFYARYLFMQNMTICASMAVDWIEERTDVVCNRFNFGFN